MALNPIVFTEKVVRSFLRYQLTAYPSPTAGLHAQMRQLLSLDETRRTPLLKGPYVSLSRPFARARPCRIWSPRDCSTRTCRSASVTPALRPPGGGDPRHLRAGHTTLVSTGTGSGKTECFLYPIISRCLELRDERAPAGHRGRDRLPDERPGRGPARAPARAAGRHRHTVRHVRRQDAGARGRRGRRPAAARPARAPTTEAARRRSPRRGRPTPSTRPRSVCSREEMRTPGQQPRILLTNVKQLELLLTRQRDVELFDGATPRLPGLRRGPHLQRRRRAPRRPA